VENGQEVEEMQTEGKGENGRDKKELPPRLLVESLGGSTLAPLATRDREKAVTLSSGLCLSRGQGDYFF